MPERAASSVFTGEFVAGREPVTVVLLPALFVGNWLWDRVWERLNGAGWPVIRFRESISLIDRHTASSINRIADALLDVCRSHTTNRLVVCGDSLGGLTALELARAFQDDVAGIVASGVPGLDMAANTLARDIGRNATDMHEIAGRFVSRLFYRAEDHDIDGERYDAVLEELGRRSSLESMLGGLRAIRNYNVKKTLPTLACPKLFLWGREDEITPVGPWEKAVPELDDARLVVLERCGHAPMYEAAEEFLAELTGFLEERAVAPGGATS